MTEPTPPHPIVRVVCKSLSPMLQDYSEPCTINAYQLALQTAISKLPRRERAEYKLYRGPHNELGFTFEMLNAAISDAIKQQEKQGVTPAILGMPFREFIPFDQGTLHADRDHPKEPKKNIRNGWTADLRKSRDGMACRAKFPTWGFTAFCYVASPDEATLQAVRVLFNLAGLSCGLGAYRPAHGGPFGTFTVVEIAAETT
ncbi:MAG: hypothetical protein WC551_05310 [Patescibacteria group bacterium]